MTATAHAIIGTLIAAKIGNLYIAIPLALASHIVCDMIPHWDPGTNDDKKTNGKLISDSFIDVLTGFVLSFLLLQVFFPQTNLFYAFFIILVAQSFDWITAPYYFFNINMPPFNWTYRFQKLFDKRLDKPWGIVTQVVVVLVILVVSIVLV